jgi:hypothetical protein
MPGGMQVVRFAACHAPSRRVASLLIRILGPHQELVRSGLLKISCVNIASIRIPINRLII